MNFSYPQTLGTKFYPLVETSILAKNARSNPLPAKLLRTHRIQEAFLWKSADIFKHVDLTKMPQIQVLNNSHFTSYVNCWV